MTAGGCTRCNGDPLIQLSSASVSAQPYHMKGKREGYATIGVMRRGGGQYKNTAALLTIVFDTVLIVVSGGTVLCKYSVTLIPCKKRSPTTLDLD